MTYENQSPSDMVGRLLNRSGLLSTDDAVNQELTAEGLLGLAEAASRFDPSRSSGFMTYAYPRVVGRVIDRMRRDRRASRTEPGIPYDESMENQAGVVGAVQASQWGSHGQIPATRTFESCITAGEGGVLLARLLGRLDPKLRRVVCEHALLQYSLADVARTVGVSTNQATRMYIKGMKCLRRFADEEGLHLDDFR